MDLAQLARNLRLTAATAAEHLGDDPAVFALQASRRLPAPFIRGLASAARRLPPGPHRALTALMDGDGAALRSILREAADGAAGPRTASFLAEIALAGHEPELAASLAQITERHRPASSLRARLAWHAGDMTAAVAALDGSNHALARRLASELAVYDGARPRLGARPVTPRAGTVLHVLTNSLPHTSSGYAQRSHSILVAQREGGWDASAVTRLGYPVQVGRVLAARRDTVDAVTYRRLLPARLRPGLEARLEQQAVLLLDLVHELRPAVLHTTTHFVNALVTGAVASATGIPWVYEVRGQLADTWASQRGPEAMQSEKYAKFLALERDAMQRADLVVTLGTEMKRNITALGVSGDKVLVAPNAVGPEYSAEPLAPADARRRLGLEPTGTWVGTVSSLVAYEGLDALVAAVALLAPRLPGLRLLVVGDGAAGPALRAQAERLGIRDRAMFTGRVPRESARLYHQALDIFAVPRRDLAVTRSVTPLKPIEAMASGRPIVASRLPALAEIVRDTVTGLLVAPGDPAALAEAIESLARSPQLRARLGETGRRYALGERTWDANARAYADAYGRIGAAGLPR